MKVSVRLFAAVRDAAGCPLMDVELPEGADVAQLRREMSERLPDISDLIGRAMFALDNRYATDTEKLSPNADVALIPPVSGG